MCPVFHTFKQFHLFSLTLGPFYIHAYGVMLALAFLLGLMLLIREGKTVGLKPEDMIDLTIYIIIMSIIGGRILYVLLSMNEYSADPMSAMKIYEGGLSYHGGALGGFMAAAYFSWRRKIPGWLIVDTGIPALVLGAAVARWGCFLNGCCYGHEWHGPWAITFPALGDGLPRHPAQLYDSLLHFVLLGLLYWLKRFKKKQGDMFAFYLMGFAAVRYIAEIFRAGATGKAFLGSAVTMAQAASILIFALGLVVFLLPPDRIPGMSAVGAANTVTAPVAAEKKKNPKNKKSGGKKNSSNKKKKKK